METAFTPPEDCPGIETMASGVHIGSDTEIYLGHGDIAKLKEWNSHLPEPPSATPYELIQRHFDNCPLATAISSWDGQVTYGDLDFLSSCLATRLLRQRVGPEDFVALYFEKSKWTPIAMVAMVSLTPAVARLLAAKAILSLKKLNLGGEHFNEQDIRQWHSHVN